MGELSLLLPPQLTRSYVGQHFSKGARVSYPLSIFMTSLFHAILSVKNTGPLRLVQDSVGEASVTAVHDFPDN